VNGCEQCGLPRPRAASRFCCLGCEIAAAVGGVGERGGAGPLLARLGLAAFLSMNVMMIAFALFGATPTEGPLPGWVTLLRWLSLLLALPAMALLVPPLLRAGWSRAGGTRWRVERLVVAAACAAFLLSAVNTVRERGDVWFDTATMVLLVVLGGGWLAARARTQARQRMTELFAAGDARHEVARDGRRLELAARELRPGDVVALGRGARLPADGVVARSDGARLDGSLLTGEAESRRVAPGDLARAGEVVRDGALELRATAVGSDATLGRLQAALERALARPSPTLRAVDRAARVLVVAAVACALAVAAWGVARGDAAAGATRALALLVVACPCSIGLAAPLTLTRALDAAARLGAVVQSLDGFERLGQVGAVAADKTGTLTTGDAATLELRPRELSGDTTACEPLLAALARASSHPIARALRERLAAVAPAPLSDPRETAGEGVAARDAQGRAVTLGRGDDHARARSPAGALLATLAIDGVPQLDVVVAERLRPGVAELGARLAERGVALSLLSGDDARRVAPLARALAAEGRGGLTPQQKAEEIARRRPAGRAVAWLCDGANDAIALAEADVSIVVDRRLEWLADAADVVLLGDRVAALPQLIDVARAARRRIVAALGWAAVYHAATLTIGVSGLLTPAVAALAMAAGSVAVVRLALRPLLPAVRAGAGDPAGSGAPIPALAGAHP